MTTGDALLLQSLLVLGHVHSISVTWHQCFTGTKLHIIKSFWKIVFKVLDITNNFQYELSETATFLNGRTTFPFLLGGLQVNYSQLSGWLACCHGNKINNSIACGHTFCLQGVWNINVYIQTLCNPVFNHFCHLFKDRSFWIKCYFLITHFPNPFQTQKLFIFFITQSEKHTSAKFVRFI